MLVGQTFVTEKEAEKGVLSAGFEGREVKVALKTIATTDAKANPVLGKKQTFEPDPELRDSESIALPIGYIQMVESERAKIIESLAEELLVNEIHPHMPDAWIDHSKTKIGYEIPFIRNFYSYTQPRPVTEIRGEIESLDQQIRALMSKLK
jgi:type I restriction enzyme M protein